MVRVVKKMMDDATPYPGEPALPKLLEKIILDRVVILYMGQQFGRLRSWGSYGGEDIMKRNLVLL